MCSICEIKNKEDAIHLFSDDELDAIIVGIYIGSITTSNLDVSTYLKIARKLSDGVYLGFRNRIDQVQYESLDYYMLRDLRENVYIFSGAKTYQQTREVSALLLKDGYKQQFGQFKKEAKQILTEYNENYLRSEYNSAIAQARTASQWMEIERTKDVLPMLTYQTAGDGRVRPTHVALNHISRPVDDKFWDVYMPPNGWNCRCDVEQSSDAIKTDLRGFKKPDDVPDIFQFNAGKERIIFSPKHPYFDVAAKDKTLAKNNFNLPLP